MLFGAISMHEQRAAELIPLFTRTIFSIPGMYGVSIQAGVFQTGLGRGRTIQLNVSGNELDRIVQISGMLFGAVKKEIPHAQVRPIPSLELLFPEVQIIPDRDRLKAAGLTAGSFGVAAVADNCRAVAGSARVVLAIKPQSFDEVAAGLADVVTGDHLLVSIMAGVGTKRIEAAFASIKARVVGVMPNLPIKVAAMSR